MTHESGDDVTHGNLPEGTPGAIPPAGGPARARAVKRDKDEGSARSATTYARGSSRLYGIGGEAPNGRGPIGTRSMRGPGPPVSSTNGKVSGSTSAFAKEEYVKAASRF